MDIVKYDNEFNLTKNFNKLSQVEQNIFFTITSEFTKNKKTHITLTADYIRQKINIQKQYRPSEVVEFMKNLSVKLSQIPFIIENKGKIIVTPIFAKFEVDKETQGTEVILNKEFLSYFYDIPLSFTQFELAKFVSIKSKYGKALFRYLLDLQHFAHERNDGKRYWTIEYDEFKKIMVFPKSYQTTSIIRNLNKSVEEINKTGLIYNCTYTKEFDTEKKGRPIKSITFVYQITRNSPTLTIKQPQPEETIPPTTITKHFCPYCHKEVCEKKGPHGQFWGHKYYKQAACKHTWSSLEELETEIALVEKANQEKEQQRAQNSKNMDILAKQRDQLFHSYGLMEEKSTYGEKQPETPEENTDPFPK